MNYNLLMKTIKEISVERGLDRSTLLKAAQRGAFGEFAKQSGATWLIDDASSIFKSWLEAHWQQPRVKGSKKKERTKDGY